MHLSSALPLSAAYTAIEIAQLVAVIQSTLPSTPLSVLRYGGVSPADATRYLEARTRKGLADSSRLPRITAMGHDGEGSTVVRNEEVVVRDRDVSSGAGEEGRSQGLIIAHASWRYYPSYSSEAAQSSAGAATNGSLSSTSDPDQLAFKQSDDADAGEFPPGGNKALHAHLVSRVNAAMDAVFEGLPCFVLQQISTLTPAYVRRGIASTLMRWIEPFADSDSSPFRMPVVLAASPLGYPLYRKCGYEEVRGKHGVVRIDMGEWGGRGEHKHVLMVRWPQCPEEAMDERWRRWKKRQEQE